MLAKKNAARKVKPFTTLDQWLIELIPFGSTTLGKVTLCLISGRRKCMLGLWSRSTWVRIPTLSLSKSNLGSVISPLHVSAPRVPVSTFRELLQGINL